MKIRALVILEFPTPPERLEWWERNELVSTLAELGRRMAAGATFGGTVIIPYPQEFIMEIRFSLEGPDGVMFEQVSTYHRLPAAYVTDIDGVCREFAAKIHGTTGGAATHQGLAIGQAKAQAAKSGPKAYKVSLAWSGDGKSGSAVHDQLLYSQACDLQVAGLVAQLALVEHGKMEVRAGERS